MKLDDRLLELTDRWLSGLATADEQREWIEVLESSADARRQYLEYAFIHAQLPFTQDVLLRDELASRADDPLTLILPSRLQGTRRSLSWASSLAVALLIIAAVGGFVSFLASWRTDQHEFTAQPISSGPPIANDRNRDHYDRRDLPIRTVSLQSGTRSQQIVPTTFTIETGTSSLSASARTEVRLDGPSLFGWSADDAGVLFDGSVQSHTAISPDPYSIRAYDLRTLPRNATYRITTLDQGRVRIEVLAGEVEVQSQRRQPRHAWNFEPPLSEDPTDLPLVLGSECKLVDGLIGKGALEFLNLPSSSVQIRGGQGTQIGTGDFACDVGISIEVLVVSRWSAAPGDYDEIFRKEDGNHRMLLSFQNDGSAHDYAVPSVPPGPCLSFGLHLEGLGYSELDMPLDGQDGRPTVADLTDGRPHHLVATYDAFTGRKTLYVDGRACFSHTFPRGRMILNGGPAPAEIGNYWSFEPFHGVIDELAYYDFALTASEVAAHYRQAMQGRPYFSTKDLARPPTRWQRITTLTRGDSQIFNARPDELVESQIP